MSDKNQTKELAGDLTAEATQTDSSPEGAESTLEESGIALQSAGAPAASEQVAAPGAEEQSGKVHEIDLSEIDAYLKTLVPGVLGMSENLVVLGDKFQGLIGEMNQRVKTVDVTINRYELLVAKKNKLIQMTLLGSLAAIFLTLTMMFVAGFNYTSQVNQMNTLSVSLARRLSEVNSGLVTFEQLNQSISALSNSTEQLMLSAEIQLDTLAQGLQAIELRLASSSTEMDSALNVLQANMSTEMSAMLQDARSSSAGMVRAIEQVGAAQRGLLETTPTLRELVALREQISALIVLQRNQYLETIAATQARQLPAQEEPAEPPPSPLQYRRDPQ
jgi:chromosome segregation ATPase